MMERYRPRIVIADNHTLIAEGCKGLLETEFEVVAIVNNGPALINSVCRLNPDVAMVDIYMPMLNGLDACEHIKSVAPDYQGRDCHPECRPCDCSRGV